MVDDASVSHPTATPILYIFISFPLLGRIMTTRLRIAESSKRTDSSAFLSNCQEGINVIRPNQIIMLSHVKHLAESVHELTS